MTEVSDRLTSPQPPSTPSSLARAVLQILFIVIVVAFALWVLYTVASTILILILAALFAYVIAPLVQIAQRPIRVAGRRRHLPRGAAIALVYVLLGGGVSAGAAVLLPSTIRQADEIISHAPAYAQTFVTWEEGWSGYYEGLQLPPGLRQTIDRTVHAAGERAIESARGSIVGIVRQLPDLPWLVLIPILAFFLLKDVAGLQRAAILALPFRNRLRMYRLLEDLNATLEAYVRAQLLACVLVGTLCGIAFAFLGVPYEVLLGLLAGALEFIPLVGPLLLATIAAIIAAIQAPMLALWTLGFLMVLRVIEDYVIYPRLIRRGVHLHPLAVILAILVGARLYGIAGMFLAVPVLAMASVGFRHWLQWHRSDGLAEIGSA
jgi:predicted PurR-regulated permease PerM